MANNACALARAKLASFVSGLGATKMDAAKAQIKGIRLFGTLTPIRNLISNGVFAGVEDLTRNTGAVALDYFQSLARAGIEAAKTGKRVDPAAYRTVAYDLDQMGFKVRAKGFQEGIAKGVDLYRNKGVDPDKVASSFDLQKVHFKNPIARAVGETVFNFMEASDKPWYQMAYQTSLYGQAKLTALREKWPAAERTARINALMQNPSDEMAFRAMSDAQYATFKDKTVFGEAAGKAKQALARIGQDRGPKPITPDMSPQARANAMNDAKGNAALRMGANVLSLGAETVLPYTSVPSSVATKGLVDYTPLGVLKTLATQLPASSRVEGDLAKGLARAGTGTALAFYLGWEGAKHGLISGSSPTSRSEGEVNTARGEPNNAVRIGDKWYSVGFLGPVAIPILAAATAWRMSKDKAESTPLETAAEAVGAGAKILTEQTYLTGMKQALDAITSPQNNASKFAAGLVPVPQIAGQVSRALDDTRRDTEGVGQKIASRAVPGYSRALPARPDIFGNDIPEDLGGFTGAAQAFVDPFNTRRAKSSPALDELARLRVGVGQPGQSFTMEGTVTPRTGEERRATTREWGPRLEQAITAAIQEPSYQAATDEQKADVLRRIRDSMRSAANTSAKAGMRKANAVDALLGVP